MLKKKSAVKKSAVKETISKSKKVTTVINTLVVLIKVLIASITEKKVIDLRIEAKTKDVVKTFTTKYFVVKAHYSQLCEREVTSKSREYLIQSMLLNNKSVKQIYNAFEKTFVESKFKSTKETFQQFKERRFNKYIKQESNRIKTLHIISSAFKS